jgi:hypothetical protein
MTLSRFYFCRLAVVILSLFIAHSADSQGYVSFDSTDSDFAAGHYYFALSGVTTDMDGSLRILSGFSISGFSALGNLQTLGAVSYPSGWVSTGSDMDGIQYQAPSLFGSDLNGLLEISAAPNISGVIDWSFSSHPVGTFPGNSDSVFLSGTSLITPTPEPSSVALVGVSAALLVIRRLYMTMWPNKSPEPTAVGACSSAVAVHAASRRWLSFFR